RRGRHHGGPRDRPPLRHRRPPTARARLGLIRACTPFVTGNYAGANPHRRIFMRSELFSAENLEKESAQPGLRLQNSKLLKAELNGEFMARTGSMVAYQGQVRFEALGSGGIGKFLKQKLTGEGVPLMRVSGQGDVFLAERAADIHLIDLDQGDAL